MNALTPRFGLALLAVATTVGRPALAQQKALVNTAASTHAKLRSVDMGSVQWTTGFWAERFAVCQQSMIPTMWALYHSDRNHAFKNFEIAAGQAQGE
ncbi:MAG: glycoside hydrolase family 127 protein, partial [Hymenobacter sp.]